MQSQSFIKLSEFSQHLKVIRQNTSNILPQSQGQTKKNQKPDRQNQLEFPQYIIKITG